jgi:hypothetical protein
MTKSINYLVKEQGWIRLLLIRVSKFFHKILLFGYRVLFLASHLRKELRSQEREKQNIVIHYSLSEVNNKNFG